MNIVPLHADAATDTSQVGSKAAGLCNLKHLGFTTPPGFVVTVSAFRRFMESAGLTSSIGALTICTDSELESRLQDIRLRIEATMWPQEIQHSIITAYQDLSGMVAVRSSGIVEDSEQSAFAGAYSTFLNRNGETEVLAAVRSCWSSAFSSRVVAYRMQHGLLGLDWLMGVIVQTMVVADKGGVMFTRDPFGDGSTMLIEAVTGGCDQIVAGAPAEISLWIDRTTRKLRRITQASLVPKRFGAGATGILERNATEAPHLLKNKEIETLVETGFRLETAFGQPQDVEWDFSDGKLVLLQTRPLTAYKVAKKPTI